VRKTNLVIPFIKAHACGNDFLIISEDAVGGYEKALLTQRLCDRNTGIGADGIEFFTWTGDFSARIQLYNADGSIAEISGNGTRCAAAWMAEDKNANPNDEFSIQTDAGIRICTIEEIRDSGDGGPTFIVTTDMDVPQYREQTVELADGSQIDGVFVNKGNPHYVIVLTNPEAVQAMRSAPADRQDFALTDDVFAINDRTWENIGEEICFHADFPEQTNVEFVIPVNGAGEPRNQVALRIYERGVGPTSSSGTGTCAAATATIAVYGGVSPIEVISPGGSQTVEWAGDGEKLYLTGPATLIARGEVW
jgi:diaminopimelate epimerase